MAGLRLDFSAIRELGKAIAGTTETRQQTKKAVVREITDGGAVVEIAGSGVLTPVESSAATYSVGDVVTVSNRGGKLHIDGDVSAPSVGAGYVRKTVQPVAEAAATAQATADSGVKAGADAQKVADEAKAAAAATNQHFWTDTNGVHVTEQTQEEWQTEQTGGNILINSLGLLLRKALNNLVSITASATAFFDGNGNEAENITARFGVDGAQIGKSSGTHTTITDGSYRVNDGELTPLEFSRTSQQWVDDDPQYLLGDYMAQQPSATYSLCFNGNTPSTAVPNGGFASGKTYYWCIDGGRAVKFTMPTASGGNFTSDSNGSLIPSVQIPVSDFYRKSGGEEAQPFAVMDKSNPYNVYVYKAGGSHTSTLKENERVKVSAQVLDLMDFFIAGDVTANDGNFGGSLNVQGRTLEGAYGNHLESSVTVAAAETPTTMYVTGLTTFGGAIAYESTNNIIRIKESGTYIVSLQVGTDSSDITGDLVGVGFKRGNTVLAGPGYKRIGGRFDTVILAPTPLNLTAGDYIQPFVQNNTHAYGTFHSIRMLIIRL